MLNYFELRKGIIFLYRGVPHQVLEFSQIKKAQREGIAQTKLKNLLTGEVIFKSFHQGEQFEEVSIEKTKVKFIFSKNEIYHFALLENPSKRFQLTEKQIGPGAKFLKSGQIVEGLKWKEKIINISLPIKVQLKVIQAPPYLKGQREKPGTKIVTVETGAKVCVPIFIEEGNVIEINTETGEYTKRIK